METSDESFAWTDASSDSSKDVISPAMNKSKQGSQEEIPETVEFEREQSGKKRKRLTICKESGYNDLPICKSIKSEPSSDFETPRSHKKRKREDINDYTECYNEAEDYLNLRVKQELDTSMESTPVNIKKKKRHTNTLHTTIDQQPETCTPTHSHLHTEHQLNSSTGVNGEQTEISETHVSPTKKKKKKTQRVSGVIDTSAVSEGLTDRHKTKKRNKETKVNILSDESEHQSQDRVAPTSFTSVDNSVEDNTHPHNDKLKEIVLSPLSATRPSSPSTGANEHLSTKACKISDRLQFEEDSIDCELQQNKSDSNILSPLKHFVRSHSNLTPASPAVRGQRVPLLGDDTEVWIVKGPREISLADLDNINLILDGRKRKIKINGKAYDISVNVGTRGVPLLASDSDDVHISNTPVLGVISLRNRVPKVHIPYESLIMSNDRSFIPLPDTKCRHPLLGADYRSAAKVPPRAARRLHGPADPPDGTHKKRKKHKTKQKLEMESDIDLKPSPQFVTSKGKRRLTEEIESESGIQCDSQLKTDINVHVKIKKKRRREEPPSAQGGALGRQPAWDCERAIERNLFDC